MAKNLFISNKKILQEIQDLINKSFKKMETKMETNFKEIDTNFKEIDTNFQEK